MDKGWNLVNVMEWRNQPYVIVLDYDSLMT